MTLRTGLAHDFAAFISETLPLHPFFSVLIMLELLKQEGAESQWIWTRSATRL